MSNPNICNCGGYNSDHSEDCPARYIYIKQRMRLVKSFLKKEIKKIKIDDY